MTAALNILAAIINTGDMDKARAWAFENADSLTVLRYNGAARELIADACNRWGAPMVWPWGDTPKPTAAEQRAIVAIRAGRRWTATHGTVAAILAFGFARVADGRWVAA